MISKEIPKGSYIRLENGRFVDVINGCYFNRGVDVVIQDNKIVDIHGIQPGEESRADFVIDLKGKTVIPGIINTHTHIQMVVPSLIYSFKMLNLVKKHQDKQIEKRMRDCLEHGVTIIRDCGTFYNPLKKNRILKERIEKGEIPGPRIYQSIIVNMLGNFMAESLGFIDYLLPLFGMGLKYNDPESSVIVFSKDATIQQVREVVDKAIEERHADYIKLAEQSYNRLNIHKKLPLMTQEQMSAIVDHAKHRGLKTTIHHVEVNSLRRAINAGVYSIAHMPIDRVLKPFDIELLMSSNSLIEPTLSGPYLGVWKMKDIPECSHPYIEMVTKYKEVTLPHIIDEYWISEFHDSIWEGINNIKQGRFKKFMMPNMKPLLINQLKGAINWLENVKLLIEAGALPRMCFANDGGFFPVNEGNIEIELGMLDLCHKLMNKRLSGIDALRYATINGAKSMGLDADFGSIEIGKTADLVIIDGDPLEDFTCIGKRVSALIKNGDIVVNNCNLEIKRVSSQTIEV